MDKRNSWYVDNKGKTILYLGKCEFSKLFNSNFAGLLSDIHNDERYLYFYKEGLLKRFSEIEIETLSIAQILQIIIEEYSYTECLFYPKKPRVTVKHLSDRAKGVKEGDIFTFNSGFCTITFKML